MSFIEEYGLLIAVSLPAAMIVAIQVFLFISGERGALLLPGSMRFEPDSRCEAPAASSCEPTEQASRATVREPLVDKVRQHESMTA